MTPGDVRAWAWEAPISSSAKLVAFGLADHVGADGRCWPSVARLARRAALATSTVKLAIAELERHGLAVERRRGAASVYQLRRMISKASTPKVSRTSGTSGPTIGRVIRPSRSTAPTGPIAGPEPPKPGRPSAPNPLREPKREPGTRAGARDPSRIPITNANLDAYERDQARASAERVRAGAQGLPRWYLERWPDEARERLDRACYARALRARGGRVEPSELEHEAHKAELRKAGPRALDGLRRAMGAA